MRTNSIDSAAAALQAGYLCAIPTETVYGLAADATNPTAIARVFEAKGRPSDHPLIVHIADGAYLGEWIRDIPEWALSLTKKFWPGPLTIVGRRTDAALNVVTGGQDTVAVRVPQHPVALELLRNLYSAGVPGLVAPSANRFGHVSPTSAEHVLADLGDYLSAHDDLVLDGGLCSVGVESTIVLALDHTPVILRPGAVSSADIESFTGTPIGLTRAETPRVSGALDSHYAPRAKVLLVSESELHNFVTHSGVGLIARDDVVTPPQCVRLLAANTNEDYARDLYASMRHADELGLETILVVAPSGDDVAIAINDRLKRAAF